MTPSPLRAPLLEEALRPPVVRFLRRRGLEVYHEVPIHGRIADLVAVGPRLTAVELKLADWRTGLRQAMGYQLACPRSYLCLPFPRALRMAYKAHYFEREGVGVLGCLPSGEVRVVFEARPSDRYLPFLGAHLRAALLADSGLGSSRFQASDLRLPHAPPEGRARPPFGAPRPRRGP